MGAKCVPAYILPRTMSGKNAVVSMAFSGTKAIVHNLANAVRDIGACGRKQPGSYPQAAERQVFYV